MSPRTTITIARQLGSGGSYIGQMIASRLGVKYIDREVLRMAAESFGLEEAEIAARDQKLSSFWERFLGVCSLGPPDGPYMPPPLRPVSDSQLFERETEIMMSIAETEDCVIMGRASCCALPPHPGMFNLYFHAPEWFRARRVMDLYHTADEKEAREIIEENDRFRKKFFHRMTGREWDCAGNYHFSMDTSRIPLDTVVDIVLGAIRNSLAAGPAAASHIKA